LIYIFSSVCLPRPQTPSRTPSVQNLFLPIGTSCQWEREFQISYKHWFSCTSV
jgi:hypothetical protein